jgi:hypothetical protein
LFVLFFLFLFSYDYVLSFLFFFFFFFFYLLLFIIFFSHFFFFFFLFFFSQVAFLCNLPENMRNLYYTNPEKFSALMAQYSQYSFSLQFLLNNGEVGMGTRDMAALLDIFQNYSMQSSMDLLANRPILINNPLLDTLMGNQSAIFFAHLPYPRHNATQLIQINPSQGAGLHCSVGSTSTLSITLLELKIILHDLHR